MPFTPVAAGGSAVERSTKALVLTRAMTRFTPGKQTPDGGHDDPRPAAPPTPVKTAKAPFGARETAPSV
jgi:hypothetical protein